MNIILEFKKVYRQMYRAVQVHGILGTFRLAGEKLCRYAEGGSLQTISTYDQMWNVQTDGNEDLSELQIVDKTNYLLGNRYQPTAPEMFEKILQAYPVPYEECTFIDCGSGKGRVLLMASELPFKRIIGVEFAEDLTEIAQANIMAYNSPTQKCRQLEAVSMDATIFPFPAEPTVLYIANPFEGSVMKKFLRHVENSLKEHPRRFYVFYRNPKFAGLWDESEFFEKVVDTELFVVYKGILLH